MNTLDEVYECLQKVYYWFHLCHKFENDGQRAEYAMALMNGIESKHISLFEKCRDFYAIAVGIDHAVEFLKTLDQP